MVKHLEEYEYIWQKCTKEECPGCGLWYRQDLKACPRCKDVNMDRFNSEWRRRPFRRAVDKPVAGSRLKG